MMELLILAVLLVLLVLVGFCLSKISDITVVLDEHARFLNDWRKDSRTFNNRAISDRGAIFAELVKDREFTSP